MAFKHIKIDHFAAFRNAAEALYGQVTEDTIEDDNPRCGVRMAVQDVLLAFNNPARMLKAFSDGYTMFLLGSYFPVIEKMDGRKEHYVIEFTKNGKTWATFTERDMNY